MNGGAITFGRFRLDIERRTLLRDGEPLKLGSRAIDILCALAAAKGELVSKDELMTRVWPGVVVEEANIQVHISALRKALDDDKDGIPLILTVPGRGYRFIASPRAAVAATDCIISTVSGPSIAVLPFENLSSDQEQEYFADGLVEDIITGLARIKWLSVIARNSSFNYKGKAVDVKRVGTELGVDYVLEGSVRKSGNRIRISAQLVNTHTGAHLWAEHYDKLLQDIFAVQDEITMCTVGAIEPSLRRAEIDRIKRKRPNNLDAYDLVLRALPYVHAQMPKDAAIAMPLLEDALKLESNYGAAHALLSWCLHARFARGGLREEDRAAAIVHARAAIVHGSDDATSIAVAAFVIALDDHDIDTALNFFDRALDLSSSNVFALNFSAIIMAWAGKTELAMARARQALRLSPFDTFNFWSHHALAIVYYHNKRYEEAAKSAQSAVDANAGFSVGRAVLAAALMRLGRKAEARAAVRALLEYQPSFTIRAVSQIAKREATVFGPFVEAWREAGLPE